jgi:hypothetical protein
MSGGWNTKPLLIVLSGKICSFILRLIMKSLVIVGSAPLEKEYSDFIDSRDLVVRFNNCKNYNVHSGKRTDILVLNNSGSPDNNHTLAFMLKPRSEEEVQQELPYLRMAEQVWFARPMGTFLQEFFKTRIDPDNRFREARLKEALLRPYLAVEIAKAQNIPESKVKYITVDLFVKVWEKLLGYGDTDALLPSTGVLGIEMIFADPLFDVYEKYIVGFGWSGWEGHPWLLEQQLVNDYLKQGRLMSVDKVKKYGKK